MGYKHSKETKSKITGCPKGAKQTLSEEQRDALSNRAKMINEKKGKGYKLNVSEEDRQNPQDLLSQLQKESDQFINIEVPNTNKIFIDSFKDYIFINLIGYTW